MTTDRKAFRHLYRLIKNGQISEKEAYELAYSIFEVNFQYIPTYIQQPTEEQQTETPVEVKGFVNNQ